MRRAIRRKVLLGNCWFLLAGLSGTALWGQTVTVTPTNESVVTGGSRQYTATVSGLANPAVTWSIAGGPTNGNIDMNGLFTAPPSVPANPNVTITATSVMNPAVSGTGIANVKSPGPVLTSLSSYSFPSGSFTVTITG